MRTVTYQSILDRIASYLGESAGLDTDDAALAQVKLALFVRLGWEYYWWPELMAIERRTFRPGWNSGTAYNAPTATEPVEVFFPTVGVGPFQNDNGEYYQALQASTGQVPATLVSGAYVENGAYWARSESCHSADAWQAGAAYGVNNDGSGLPYQVLNPADGRYYQCLAAHTSGGSFDATKWGILTPFIRSLDYEQAGETPLGEVRFIWDRNPETDGRTAKDLRKRLRSDHVQVLGLANVVWVEFRLRPRIYAGPIRSDSAAYADGQEVFDVATGDFWMANQTVNAGESPASTPAKWGRVEFPYFLAEYAAQSAYAALTDREQEQPENFAVEDGAGWPLLAAELDKVERQQGQVRQLNVVSGRHRGGGWFY
jgi:hypothetical protein